MPLSTTLRNSIKSEIDSVIGDDDLFAKRVLGFVNSIDQSKKTLKEESAKQEARQLVVGELLPKLGEVQAGAADVSALRRWLLLSLCNNYPTKRCVWTGNAEQLADFMDALSKDKSKLNSPQRFPIMQGQAEFDALVALVLPELSSSSSSSSSVPIGIPGQPSSSSTATPSRGAMYTFGTSFAATPVSHMLPEPSVPSPVAPTAVMTAESLPPLATRSSGTPRPTDTPIATRTYQVSAMVAVAPSPQQVNAPGPVIGATPSSFTNRPSYKCQCPTGIVASLFGCCRRRPAHSSVRSLLLDVEDPYHAQKKQEGKCAQILGKKGFATGMRVVEEGATLLSRTAVTLALGQGLFVNTVSVEDVVCNPSDTTMTHRGSALNELAKLREVSEQLMRDPSFVDHVHAGFTASGSASLVQDLQTCTGESYQFVREILKEEASRNVTGSFFDAPEDVYNLQQSSKYVRLIQTNPPPGGFFLQPLTQPWNASVFVAAMVSWIIGGTARALREASMYKRGALPPGDNKFVRIMRFALGDVNFEITAQSVVYRLAFVVGMGYMYWGLNPPAISYVDDTGTSQDLIPGAIGKFMRNTLLNKEGLLPLAAIMVNAGEIVNRAVLNPINSCITKGSGHGGMVLERSERDLVEVLRQGPNTQSTNTMVADRQSQPINVAALAGEIRRVYSVSGRPFNPGNIYGEVRRRGEAPTLEPHLSSSTTTPAPRASQ